MREILRQRGVVAAQLSLLQRDLRNERKALPKSFWPVRMKALKFHLNGVAGKVVSHARMMFLKITEGPIGYREARSQLVEFSSA